MEKRSCSLYGNAPFFMYIICFWYTARSEFNKSGRSCARSLFFLRKNAPLLSSFYLYSYALQICKGYENLESVSRRTETSTGFAIWAFMPDSSAFRRSSSNAFARHGDNRDFPAFSRECTDRFCGLIAVHVRHLNIHQNNIVIIFWCVLDCF